MGFTVLQELESRYDHGAPFSRQLEISLVYFSEVQFTVVGKMATKVMDCF